MSDNDVFNIETTTPQTTDDLLASIKNESGEQKYKSVEDGIKALASSQAFISTLISEKRELEAKLHQSQEQVNKSKSIEDVLKELTAKDSEPKPKVEDPPVGTSVSEETIAALVKNELEKSAKNAQEVHNASEVQNALISKFGDKAPDVIAAKAAELGTTPKELGDLAKKNPKMVLSLFNTGKAQVTPTSSSINLPTNPAPIELESPTKSLLLGATSNEQRDYMKKVKDAVYAKYNVQV